MENNTDRRQFEELVARINMVYEFMLKIEKKIVLKHKLSRNYEDYTEEEIEATWLYANQTAKALGISERKLQRLQKARKIEFARLGKTPRFHPYEVYRVMKNNVVKCSEDQIELFRTNYAVDDDK